MNKILSIIIPTYNMQEYLPYCIGSIIQAESLDKLDVIIVNDGSTDSSLKTSQGFQNEYPESIRVIDKPNGNYGSAINAALPLAKGKYVTILDADDSLESEALKKFIKILSQTDSDIFVTHFTQIHPGQTTEIVKYNTMGKEPYEYGKTYDLDDILPNGYIRFFLVHQLTYRTELLVSNNYRQSENIFYTDTQWCIFPLYYANTITFIDLNLYRYNLCRTGQSMEPSVLFKSTNQMETVTDSILSFYTTFDKTTLTPTRKEFICQYHGNRIRLMYKLHLLDIPREQFDKNGFTEIFKKYDSFCTEHKINIKLIPYNRLLRIDMVRYWRKHHDRLPYLLDKTNRVLDTIANFLYIKLIRK